VVINVWILSNPLAQYRCNEQKVITRAKKHTNLEWDRLQVVVRNTLEVLRPTFIKLASSHIFLLIGMTTWCVESIPFNV
jgi:hypothetical protein